MAVTTEISWGDGTSDKIYLTRNASEGNQTVLVSSDANTGAARSKVVTFSASGATPVTLTVSQAAGAEQPVFYDRLVFDGVAYIEVPDITPPTDFSFRVTLGGETLKATQRLFSFIGTNGNFSAFLNSSTTNTNRCFSIYYGSTSVLSNNRTIGFSYLEYNFFLTPKRFGWGTTSYTISKGTSVPSGGLYLGIFANGGQPYTGKMGVARIYGSDAQNVTNNSGFANYTPVYTLRPCTYKGEAGIWCIETNKFYGNSAGAGTLSVENN